MDKTVGIAGFESVRQGQSTEVERDSLVMRFHTSNPLINLVNSGMIKVSQI